jgi:ribosome-associated protein
VDPHGVNERQGLRSGPLEGPVVALVAARAADAKAGADTVVLAMGELLGITDAFVVTSGRNVRQVRTIVEEVERQVRRDLGRRPLMVEGLADARWVLLDYGEVVVHVFLEEARSFYGLERLWGDAPRLAWSAHGADGRGSVPAAALEAQAGASEA